jgi:hypothetical protein
MANKRRFLGFIPRIIDPIRLKLAGMAMLDLAKFPEENPNPVLRITQDGMVLYANKASASLLASRDCIVEEYLPDVWRQQVTAVLASGSSVEVETAVSPL